MQSDLISRKFDFCQTPAMTCQDVPKNVYIQTHELPKNWVQNGLDRPLKSHLPEKFGQ